jgi:hypothetical protein
MMRVALKRRDDAVEYAEKLSPLTSPATSPLLVASPTGIVTFPGPPFFGF